MAIIAVVGIDTAIGKTYATGLLGRYLKQQGRSVITAKIAQTGVEERSEDILLHRQLMGLPWLSEDNEGLTCPYVFPFPASPHLSAALANQTIDLTKLKNAFSELEKKFETVLLEGVGGLMVPLINNITTLDFIAEQQMDTILVSTSKLGSINHTLLSMEALEARSVPVKGILYNLFAPAPKLIMEDSKKVFHSFYPHVPIATIPPVSLDQGNLNFKLDFSAFNM